MDQIIPAFCKPIAYTQYNLPDEIYANLDIAFSKSKMNYIKPSADKSDVRGQSYNMHVLNEPVLKDLKTFLYDAVKIYWEKDLEYDCDFRITTSWFTKNSNNSKVDWHCHTNSFLSGVFYFGDYFSDIMFRNFDFNHYDFGRKRSNVFNGNEWVIKPQKGLLILFPSQVYHAFLPAEKERKSMAFNIIPVGEYGYNDSKVHIIDGYSQ